MVDGFSERLRATREHLGLSVTAAATAIGLKNRGTWANYEKGASRPDADALAYLHSRGIDINWLLTGEGTMVRADAPLLAGTVPVMGLAECGLRGWYQESPTGLFAAAPPAVAADPGGLAVVAIGESMRPVGIRPGDLVFCQTADSIKPGELVLVELVDGTMALKQWSGTTSGWVTLQGWLEADDSGVQMPYQDERRRDQVKAVWRVALVQPGLAQQVAPGSAAGADYSQDDRLYEIAIKTTLGWYDAAGMETVPDNLASMISRSVRLLRFRQGDQIKTDSELAVEVSHILDIAREMLSTAGWKPK